MLGNFGIAFSKHSKWTDRVGVIIKMSLTALVWIAGIVLSANTNIPTVYKTVYTYNVTAGVGPFKGDFVPEFLDSFTERNKPYNYSVIPYTLITASANLITNTMNTIDTNTMNMIDTTPVVPCEANQICDSYLLTGGLMLTDPWESTDFPDEPVITIKSAPVTQTDFIRGSAENYSYDDVADCSIYGEQQYGIRIKFCLARQPAQTYKLNAKLYACQGDTSNGECLTYENASISTSFSVYTRHATFDAARSNFTVLNAQTLDDAKPQSNLDIVNLKVYFSWLFDFNAANIPAPSAPASYFWWLKDQLSNPIWNVEALQLLQSLIAFPFWHFQENNFGNVRLQGNNITQDLAPDFYTTAAIGTPYLQIVVDKSMFIAFCILQLIIILFVWVVLAWLLISNRELPEISTYPLIDFATKTNIHSQSQYISKGSFDTSFEASTDSSQMGKLLKDGTTTLRVHSYESPTLCGESPGGLTPIDKRARTA